MSRLCEIYTKSSYISWYKSIHEKALPLFGDCKKDTSFYNNSHTSKLPFCFSDQIMTIIKIICCCFNTCCQLITFKYTIKIGLIKLQFIIHFLLISTATEVSALLSLNTQSIRWLVTVIFFRFCILLPRSQNSIISIFYIIWKLVLYQLRLYQFKILRG